MAMKEVFELKNGKYAAQEITRLYDKECPCRLTIGLSYRNPRTNNVPMSAERLVERIRESGNFYLWSAFDNGSELVVKAYSDNDLF
ncbi:MAG: hypothetical protein IJG82_09500 [Atopobiaceae bacterium]|nr:hypothetical protein [Atopobiaceae bacterium]